MCAYEVLAGKQAFEGDTVTDILAKILEREPNWSALIKEVPESIRVLLRRCLQKDRNRRLRDIGDARIELEDTFVSPMTLPAKRVALDRETTFPLPAESRPVVRLTMGLATDMRLAQLDRPSVAVAPGGTHLVYVANDSSTEQLYLRTMDQLDAKPIPGTEGGYHPFFSPDGQWVGFFAAGKLKKVSIRGGTPLTLCDAVNPRGASWGPNDTIVFAPIPVFGLSKISASGGTPICFKKISPVMSLRFKRPILSL